MKSGLKNIVTALKKIAINRLLYKSYEKKGNKISLQILVLDLKSEVWQFVFFSPDASALADSTLLNKK